MSIDLKAMVGIGATVSGQGAVDSFNKSLERTGQVGERSAKQIRIAFQQLPAQFTDIATQLAGGQNPFLILLQQGGQIKDSFGSFGTMFRQLASTITLARVAMVGAAGAVGLLGFAFYKGQAEATAFNKQMALSGNIADLNYSKFLKLSGAIASSTGTSVGNSKELVMGAAGTGAFGPESLAPAVTAMAQLQKISGQTADEVVKDFASMARGVSAWAAQHNRQYGYITLDQFKYIQALERAGQTEKAMAYNSQLLSDELKARTPQLGFLEKAWIAVGNAASRAWDKMLNIGRPDTLASQIAKAEAELKDAEAAMARRASPSRSDELYRERFGPELAQKQANLAALQEQQREMGRLTQKQSELDAAERKRVEDEASGLNDRKRVASAESEYITLQRKVNTDTAAIQAKQIMLDEDYAYHLMTKGEQIREETKLQQAQKELDIKLAEGRVRQAQAIPLGPDAASVQARANQIQQARDEVAKLKQELDAIAHGGSAKAAVADFNDDRALQVYKDNLKQQNELLLLQGQQVNMTDEAYAALVRTKQRDYEISVKTKDMPREQADAYKAAAQSAGELEDAIRKVNYEQSRTFEYGAKQAFKTYYDEISNLGKQTSDVMGNAFRSIEDSLVDFVKTGKFNFADLARSIVNDLIKVYVQAMIMKPIMDALGIGGAGKGGGGFTIANVAAALFSFDGGGYTGDGARAGGVDGKGGFPAILHPNESVIDHTKGQTMSGGSVANVSVTVNATTGQTNTQGDGSNIKQLGNNIASLVRQEIMNQQRPGGLLRA